MTLDEEIDAIKSDSQLENERVEAEEKKDQPKEPDEVKEPEAAPAVETETAKPEGDVAQEETPDEGKGDEEAEKNGDSFGKPGHTPSGVQKRINELTSKTRALESSLAEKDREIAEMKRKMEGMRETTKEDFINGGKTEQDWINHVVAQRSREEAVKIAEKMRDEEEFKADLPGFHQSEELARRLFPDYDVVIGSGDLPGTPKLSKFIRKDNVFGAQMLYTLMKFPQERSLYVNAATEDDKLVVLQNLQSKLKGIAEKFGGKPQQPAEPGASNEIGKKEEPKKPLQLREPAERQPGVTGKKKLNPSECSMEEWMNDGY